MDKEQVINDVTFKFDQIPSKESLRLFTKVSKAVAPILEKLSGIGSVKDLNLDTELNKDMVASISGALMQLDEEKLEYFRLEFAKYSRYMDPDSGKYFLLDVTHFDRCFKGDVFFMFKWMIMFVRVNFLAGMNF